MNALRALACALPCLILAACGGSSGPDAGVPDFGWVDTAMPDYGDVPGVDLPRPDKGTDEGEEDAPGQDLPVGDVPLPDAGPDAGPDAPDPAADPGTDPFEPDATEVLGTCAKPVDVWAGRSIGAVLPAELGYEARTGEATAPTAPSCQPAGTAGEVVFRMVLDRPVFAVTSVEPQAAGFAPYVSYVKESCAGGEADCTASDNGGGLAELGTALTPGTWIALVRLVPQAGGNPVGVAVDVAFSFEPGEICDNGQDDNSDGDADCDDPTCFAEAFCTGGHDGEDCQDPFLINGGAPAVPGVEVFVNNTLGGRRDDFAAPAPCWPGSAGSGDAVWRIVLDREMTLEAAVGFFDGTLGHAYVMDESCTALQGCVPATFTGDPNLLVTLPAGTWHLVVDRGTPAPANLAFELAIFFDEP